METHMTWYQIIKKRKGQNGYQLLIHPFVDGDRIYEFKTLQEANNVLKEISSLQIYNDINLSIVKINY